MTSTSQLPTARAEKLLAEKALVKKVQEFLRQRAPDAVLTSTFETFYRTYTKTLHGMAWDKGFRGAERDDLVQEAWLQVLKHFREHDWEPCGCGLRGWLYRLLCNKACDAFRAKRRNRIELAPQSDLEAVADRAADDGWQARFDEQLLQQLMGRLDIEVSPINRRLLTMLWIERRSRAEVARELQLTPEQIKYRQYRVFGKLRIALSVYRGEPFPEAPTSE
jgi:RNA polymerase sigma factor (sigma-70 family)